MTMGGFSFIMSKSAREGRILPRWSAMNREIAPTGGNFRGVCPTIRRLREIRTLRRSLRHDLRYRPEFAPVFFMSWNDTHG